MFKLLIWNIPNENVQYLLLGDKTLEAVLYNSLGQPDYRQILSPSLNTGYSRDNSVIWSSIPAYDLDVELGSY